MTPHLTDEALQAHLFQLSEGEDTATHLSACPECTERFEQLQQQFSALDLLREDLPLREELVADTLAKIATRRAAFPWKWAVGIAAGILLLWAIMQTGPKQPETPETAKTPEVTVEEDPEWVLSEELQALRKEPPFAPGSNIELNVLPRRDAVQLSIYNSADLTLVRERRSLTMKKGWNWMQFMWANTLIDPTSLSLESLTHRKQVSVEQLVFPPRMQGVGRWLLFSAVSGPVEFEITYFTSGISWRAFYMGTLSTDETHLDMNGYVRVENQSGDDYEQAQTRLVVGKVNLMDQIAALAKRPHAYGSPVPLSGQKGKDQLGRDATRLHNWKYEHRLGDRFERLKDGWYADGGGDPKEIRKEGLSEYFLYTIEGKETIRNTWAKRLPSFQAETIPVESLYKYDEERWGAQTIRFLSFTNDEKHELGETPLPNGTMRIYRQLDAEQHLDYVGGADVKYIPVDEEVELELGPAQKVLVEPKLMATATDHLVFDGNGNITGWDTRQDWTFDLRNTRELPIKLEITRATGTSYWALKMTAANGTTYMKHDLNHARFEVTIPPRTYRTFSYQLTTYHGTREQHAKQ